MIVNGIEFEHIVFKGGTSLILLLKEENRFSVDLDIICPTDRATLEKTLGITKKLGEVYRITGNCIFINVS
ncbi:hypothetical protein ES708_26611 [subsurface metagenome]